MQKNKTMKKVTLSTLIILLLAACSNENKENASNTQNTADPESQRYDDALADKLSVFEPLEIKDTLNPALVKLGHHLYFDNQLSRKQTMSCNTCHNLSTFGVDNNPTSKGEEENLATAILPPRSTQPFTPPNFGMAEPPPLKNKQECLFSIQ